MKTIHAATLHMSGKATLPVGAEVIDCRTKANGQLVLVCLIDIDNDEKVVNRFFAAIKTGAKIDGEFRYIGPVPESELYLFELLADAKVIL